MDKETGQDQDKNSDAGTDVSEDSFWESWSQGFALEGTQAGSCPVRHLNLTLLQKLFQNCELSGFSLTTPAATEEPGTKPKLPEKITLFPEVWVSE